MDLMLMHLLQSCSECKIVAPYLRSTRGQPVTMSSTTPATRASGDTAAPAAFRLTPEARLVFIGLMIGMFVAAISQTIVSPALPIIVAELGGMEHYSWLATSAMLASAVVVPIVG